MHPTEDNVGITTTWSVSGLRSLKSNGLVDSVSYVVYCREQVGVGLRSLKSNGLVDSVLYQVVCREQVGIGLSATIKTNRYSGHYELEGDSPTIALADLTEENVIGWVKTGLGSTEVTRIENSVAPPKTKYDFDDTREIRESSSLPWS